MKKLVCLLLVVCLFASIGTGAMAEGYATRYAAKLTPMAKAASLVRVPLTAKVVTGTAASNALDESDAEKLKLLWLGNGQDTYDKLKTEGVDFDSDGLDGMSWEEVFTVHSAVDLSSAQIYYMYSWTETDVPGKPTIIGKCDSLAEWMSFLKSQYTQYPLGCTVELQVVAYFSDESTLTTPMYVFTIKDTKYETYMPYIRERVSLLKSRVDFNEFYPCMINQNYLIELVILSAMLPRWKEFYPDVASELDEVLQLYAKKYQRDRGACMIHSLIKLLRNDEFWRNA